MARRNDCGMTLMEVVLAISIFAIGVLFLIKADQVMSQNRTLSEQRQQMLFAAAGQLEKLIETGTTGTSSSPVSVQILIGGRTFTFLEWSEDDPNLNPHLKIIHVKAEGDDFELKGYRVQ